MHAPLDESRLGPRVVRLTGPDANAAQRELAARALIPLPGTEPWLALYQLWALGVEPSAALASRTATELPGPSVFTALADPRLPAVALDFMARRRLSREAELAVLVRHPQVDGRTLELVARCGPARVCEAIAAAPARFLARPEILAALARNPHCPQAVLHAAVELGARERAPGLAGLRHALLSGHVRPDSLDEHAARVAAARRSRPGEDLDPAPALPPDPTVPLDAAAPPDPVAPPAPIVVPISAPRSGPRPVDLVLDPSTPLPLAMSLLCQLRPPDLRRVAHARRLAAPLVAAARRRIGPG